MSKFKLGLILGIIAGVIDVIPMIIQKLAWSANISAFVFWVVFGFIISHFSLNLKGWQKGMILAILLYLPIMIIVGSSGLSSLAPMAVSAIVLGGSVGLSMEKFGK